MNTTVTSPMIINAMASPLLSSLSALSPLIAGIVNVDTMDGDGEGEGDGLELTPNHVVTHVLIKLPTSVLASVTFSPTPGPDIKSNIESEQF